MNHRLIRRSALSALLAGAMAVGTMTTTAHAAVDALLRVTIPGAQLDFRTTPRWVAVPGTRVYVVRDDMRPRQDFFRFDDRYYVYDDGTWYRSNRWNGRYVVVKAHQLPPQFRQVPHRHWRAYPADWRHDRRDARHDLRDERRDDRREDRQDRRQDRRDDRRDPRGSW